MNALHPKRRLTHNGISCIDVGRGSTVVLLHGVGLCADVWLPQQNALARNHRVVCLDLPGHGGSAALDSINAPTLMHFVQMITDAVQELDCGKITLVGHSLGALIAASMAHEQKVLIGKLCLLSTVFQRPVAAQRAVIRRAEELRKRGGEDSAAAPLARWFGDEQSERNYGHARQCRIWLNHAATRGYASAYRVFSESSGPSAESLQAVTVPTLVLTGIDDPNSTANMAQAMAHQLPQGRTSLIAGAAHMLTMTHANVVSAELMDFVCDNNAV